MKIAIFNIPVWDDGKELEKMNRFLQGNKVVEVESRFWDSGHGASWCFCVKYLPAGAASYPSKKRKIDYKEVLDEKTFQRFSKLREIRKKVATEESIPAFAVFTDEELASMAGLEKIDEKSMLGIKGIGNKKVDRFGKYFFTQEGENEKSRASDIADSGTVES